MLVKRLHESLHHPLILSLIVDCSGDVLSLFLEFLFSLPYLLQNLIFILLEIIISHVSTLTHIQGNVIHIIGLDLLEETNYESAVEVGGLIELSDYLEQMLVCQ